MKSIVCATIVAAYFLAVVSATEVKTCKSDLPLPNSVSVKDCEKGTCLFPRGSVAEWNVTFDAPHDLETFQPRIFANFLGAEVEFPGGDPEGCNGLVADVCPLEEGQRVVYLTKLEILEWYPTVPITVEMFLYTADENGKSSPFSCFSMDLRITTN